MYIHLLEKGRPLYIVTSWIYPKDSPKPFDLSRSFIPMEVMAWGRSHQGGHQFVNLLDPSTIFRSYGVDRINRILRIICLLFSISWRNWKYQIASRNYSSPKAMCFSLFLPEREKFILSIMLILSKSLFQAGFTLFVITIIGMLSICKLIGPRYHFPKLPQRNGLRIPPRWNKRRKQIPLGRQGRRGRQNWQDFQDFCCLFQFPDETEKTIRFAKGGIFSYRDFWKVSSLYTSGPSLTSTNVRKPIENTLIKGFSLLVKRAFFTFHRVQRANMVLCQIAERQKSSMWPQCTVLNR